MKNPFSLTFGKSPQNMIPRNRQNNEIIEGFRDDPPGFQVCMITVDEAVSNSHVREFVCYETDCLDLIAADLILCLGPGIDIHLQ